MSGGETYAPYGQVMYRTFQTQDGFNNEQGGASPFKLNRSDGSTKDIRPLDDLNQIVKAYSVGDHITGKFSNHGDGEDKNETLTQAHFERASTMTALASRDQSCWPFGWTDGPTFRTKSCIWHGEHVGDLSTRVPVWSPDSTKVCFPTKRITDGMKVHTWSVLHVDRNYVQDISAQRLVDNESVSDGRNMIAADGSARDLYHVSAQWMKDNILSIADGALGSSGPKTILKTVVMNEIDLRSEVTSDDSVFTHAKGELQAMFPLARFSAAAVSPDGAYVAYLYGDCVDISAGLRRAKNYMRQHHNGLHNLVIGSHHTASFEISKIIPIEVALFAMSVTWSHDGSKVCVGTGGGRNSALVYDVTGHQAELVVELPQQRKQHWDKKIGKWLNVKIENDHGVTAIQFSPTGKYLAVGCSNLVCVYDTSEWVMLQQFDINETAISSDSFKTKDGNQDIVKAGVLSISWCPTGSRFATSTDTRGISIVHVSSGTVQSHFAFDNAMVAWSPDSVQLCAHGDDGEIRVFNVGNHAGGIVRAVDLPDIHEGHPAAVGTTQEVWSPDRSHCCLVRERGSIVIGSLASGKVEYHEPIDEFKHCTHILWSPNNYAVAVAYENSHLFLLKREIGEGGQASWRKVTVKLFGHTVGDQVSFGSDAEYGRAVFNDPKYLSWNSTGDYLLADIVLHDGKQKLAAVVDALTGEALDGEYPGQLAGHWSPDGKMLVSWDANTARAHVISIPSFRIERTVPLESKITDFSWGADSHKAVVACQSKIMIFNISKFDVTFGGLALDDVYSVNWSPYSNDSLVVFDSKGVHCVDPKLKRVLWSRPNFQHPKYGPVWGPIGERVFAFGSGGQPVALRLSDGENCESWDCFLTVDTSQWTVQQNWSWSPDGRLALVHFSNEGRVVLLDAATGALRRNPFSRFPSSTGLNSTRSQPLKHSPQQKRFDSQEENFPYDAFVWSSDGRKICMAHMQVPQPMALVVFDWATCNHNKPLTMYSLDQAINVLCLSDDIDHCCEILRDNPLWATERLPRYGLHLCYLLAAKGDAYRMKRYAEVVPALTKMFAVAVPVLLEYESPQLRKSKTRDPSWVHRISSGVNQKKMNRITDPTIRTFPDGKRYCLVYPVDIALERKKHEATKVLIDWMNLQTSRGHFIPSVDMAKTVIRLAQENSTFLPGYLEAFLHPAKLQKNSQSALLLSADGKQRQCAARSTPSDDALDYLDGSYECGGLGKRYEFDVWTLNAPHFMTPRWLFCMIECISETDRHEIMDSPAIRALIDFLWDTYAQKIVRRWFIWHMLVLLTLIAKTTFFTVVHFETDDGSITIADSMIFSLVFGIVLVTQGATILFRESYYWQKRPITYCFRNLWNTINVASGALCVASGVMSLCTWHTSITMKEHYEVPTTIEAILATFLWARTVH